MRPRLLLLAVLSLLAACHQASRPDDGAAGHTIAAPPALLAPPPSCGALTHTVPVLTVPDTDAPKLASASKEAPLEISQVHTVNRALQDVGTWADRDDGWSLLALQLGSRRARSISVRLRELRLPSQSEVWLCSADGKQRHGPLQASAEAEIWPHGISGNAARIEVWVPTARRAQFHALLADVYGGYR